MRLPKDFSLLPKYISQDMYNKVGNAIAKDMVTQFNSAIRSFYNDYDPVVYKRKYRSYFFAHKSGTRGYVKFKEKIKNGSGFVVRMNITPDNIRVPYTNITGGYSPKYLNNMVFYNTFVLGQHGGRLRYDILSEDYRSIISKFGSERWKPYSDIGWAWEPPRMDVPPLVQMDRWYKDYTAGGGIQKTVDAIAVRSIEKILKSWGKQHLKK